MNRFGSTYNSLKERETFCRFLGESEEWLMERILAYAVKYDYTKYTSTLKEAWRMSIQGLSNPLIHAIRETEEIPELGADLNYQNDPIAAFGIEEARKHRARGIEIDMFLGLFKYYKQSYLDLVETADCKEEIRQYLSHFTRHFFDRIEIGFVAEWVKQSKEQETDDLKSQNRHLANEKNRN
ncbi:MAG: hypothetical protein C4527_03270 [Candidatus Omnitrophota bacterium]|jgi:hypothetical protein|nr:MAG: hypothetical protein C4527_03270 [Candidatus Omnitrophota bacterium]